MSAQESIHTEIMIKQDIEDIKEDIKTEADEEDPLQLPTTDLITENKKCLYTCVDCGFSTPIYRKLFIHRKKIHSPDAVCSECGKAFKLRGTVQQHFREVRFKAISVCLVHGFGVQNTHLIHIRRTSESWVSWVRGTFWGAQWIQVVLKAIFEEPVEVGVLKIAG